MKNEIKEFCDLKMSMVLATLIQIEKHLDRLDDDARFLISEMTCEPEDILSDIQSIRDYVEQLKDHERKEIEKREKSPGTQDSNSWLHPCPKCGKEWIQHKTVEFLPGGYHLECPESERSS